MLLHPNFYYFATRSIQGIQKQRAKVADPAEIISIIRRLNKNPLLIGKIPLFESPNQLRKWWQKGKPFFNLRDRPTYLRNVVCRAHQKFLDSDEDELRLSTPQSLTSLSNEVAFRKFCDAAKTGQRIIGDVSKDVVTLLKHGQGEPKGVTPLCKETRPRRVLVLSDNWTFMPEVLRALQAENAEVRTLDFSYIYSSLNSYSERVDRNLSIAHHLFVRGPEKITGEQAMGALNATAPLARNLIDWCDVVFVEWANATAVWTSHYLPSDKKLVVRCHSYEALSHWPVFIAHHRVDGMVFIADHIRQIYELHFNELGGLDVSSKVIPNLRGFDEFLGVAGAHGREKTLGMLKFADANKDPIFALEVLEELLHHDNQWSLRFGGAPFPESPSSRDESTYAEEFMQRASIVKEHLVFDGFQEKPQDWFAQVGFIISASKREGSHESIVEGMASGCVPVLRRWPLVKDFGAPSTVFPGIESHETPIAAAKHILDAKKAFNERSQAARDYVKETFEKEKFGAQLAKYILS